MSRDVVISGVVVALVGYGLYIGSYLLPMFVGTPPIAIVIGFAVQTIASFAAAAGALWRRSWAPAALIVLGVAIAFTAIVEGFVLGLVGYNHAVAVAVTGLVLTILTAIYVSRDRVGARLSVVR